jgi:CHAD domain-containing protein
VRSPSSFEAVAAAEILSRSPEEGSRRLALSYLDQAAQALPRLHGGDDPEALHDLRVALRRLRSCLNSYQDHLGAGVPRKLVRRLRRLARATGPGRDTEVQLEWVRKHGRELARHHRPGRDWLQARLEQRLEQAYGDLRGELQRGFAPCEEKLRGRLSVYRAEVRLDGGRLPAFGDAAAALVEDHAARLERRLTRVGDAGDVAAAHQARITAKRLRYLADPLVQLVDGTPRTAAAGEEPQPEGPSAPTHPSQLVHRLKGLQDNLGELHDAHVMEAELARALREAAAERAARLFDLTLEGGDAAPARLRSERRRPWEPGLLELARLNRSRRDSLHAEFVARWQGTRRAELLAAAEALAEALRIAAHPDDRGEAAPAAGANDHPAGATALSGGGSQG